LKVLRSILERLQKRADTLSTRADSVSDALAQLERCIDDGDVDGAKRALESLVGNSVGTKIDVLKARLALLEQQYERSEQVLNDVLLYEPRNAEALAWQAATQMHLQRPESALELGSRAQRLGYQAAWLHELIGFIYFFAGQAAEAISSWQKAVALEPERINSHRNLVEAYAKLGLWTEQQPHLDRAMASDGATPTYLTYRGFGLLEQGQDKEAWPLFEQALAAGTDPGVIRNAASAYFNAGQLEACEAVMARAPVDGPDQALFAVTRANIELIRNGPSPEAWRQYEARQQTPDWTVLADGPRWDGQPLRPGQRLVVACEQGLGDTLMFARLLPRLARRAAGPTTFVVPPALFRLMLHTQAKRPGWEGVEIISGTYPGREGDVFMPLMSAFHVARLPFEGQESGYLTASDELRQTWRTRLGPTNGKKRVGLVWAGNPNRADDRIRSIPTADLAVLAAPKLLDRVTFVNLQMNARTEYLAAPLPFPCIDLRPQITDFADSAALVSQLDYVISIDTAAAHLAGAAGTACAVLLSSKPDWRWSAGERAQPWYGSHRSHVDDRGNAWTTTLQGVSTWLAKAVSDGQ
jgi:tetratricopeptide (TPR) repeat protein